MSTSAARDPDRVIDGPTVLLCNGLTELRGTHFVQMEQPEAVHALLLEFLEKVS